jgi:hypothetical protein
MLADPCCCWWFASSVGPGGAWCLRYCSEACWEREHEARRNEMWQRYSEGTLRAATLRAAMEGGSG